MNRINEKLLSTEHFKRRVQGIQTEKIIVANVIFFGCQLIEPLKFTCAFANEIQFDNDIISSRFSHLSSALGRKLLHKIIFPSQIDIDRISVIAKLIIIFKI